MLGAFRRDIPGHRQNRKLQRVARKQTEKCCHAVIILLPLLAQNNLIPAHSLQAKIARFNTSLLNL